tara:strand:- start:190 stop:375 length:186 start_codon:yes stop_codon:yes gene_type:complete
MFKVGDVVFLIESGTVNYAKIGLILEKAIIPRSRNQYKVQFSNSVAAWWEENYLYKIEDNK